MHTFTIQPGLLPGFFFCVFPLASGVLRREAMLGTLSSIIDVDPEGGYHCLARRNFVDINNSENLELTAEIVAAYVSNNPVPASELPGLIGSVHQSLQGLANSTSTAAAEQPKPAVPIKKSITPDYLVCLEDGEKYKSLKRTLKARYGMTPDEYRAKWGLPADYPMTAPNYAAQRSELAKQIGLGRKSGQKAPAKHRRKATA